jgi:hypothetical protein
MRLGDDQLDPRAGRVPKRGAASRFADRSRHQFEAHMPKSDGPPPGGWRPVGPIVKVRR